MHPWDLSVEEARMLQESLASDCVLEGDPEVDTIAAVDISMYRESKIGIASAVLYSLSSQQVLEETVYLDDLTFPYVPGLLAFREAPVMLETIMKLNGEPDCLLIDGHGYAHPRRFGLASHLGLLLDLPSIGCAKSSLVGEYDEPDRTPGAFSDIWDGEPVGYAIRTRQDANPIYVSPGHKISRENVLPIIRRLNDGRTKLPSPLHQSDRLAGRTRKNIRSLGKPFRERDIGVFLVGGALRDLLMGMNPSDYDLLVTDLPSSVREEIEDYMESGFFDLDADRRIYRCSGKDLQVDVTVIEKDEVIEDLKRRDFTVNSIALDLERESWIDPVSGRDDIQNNVLRPTDPTSISEDPLRILRAYRLSQSKGFSFSQELKEEILENGSKLAQVSKERILEELLRVTSGRIPEKYLEKMMEDGLFAEVSFFRGNGISDVRSIESWKSVLKGHNLLLGDYHGGYELLTGFKVGRLIQVDELDQWPLHNHIKSVARASHERFSKKIDFEILNMSHRSLLGRILGEGLRGGWSSEKIGNVVSRLQRFISERSQIEKEFVESIESEDVDIGQEKEKHLRERLPQLWEESMQDVELIQEERIEEESIDN